MPDDRALDQLASTRSARSRSTPSRRRTPATRARRWRSPRPPTCSTRRSCSHNPADPGLAGPRPLRALGRPRLDAALREPAPLGLRRSASTRSSTSASSARTRPATPSTATRPGVETTTGPLGQGFGNARRDGDGRALPARALRAEVCDHHIFGICSDGDLMEGVASEAASIAGHLGLGRLVFVYDDNHITIDGSTDLTFSRRTSWSASAPTAGTRSPSRTATTSTRSRRRFAPGWPSRSVRR